jgi:hypothetical protein
VRTIAEKHVLSEHEIREGKRRGNVIAAEDYGICGVDEYGDWAEYQYDIRGNKIYFGLLAGWWRVQILDRKKSEKRLIRMTVVTSSQFQQETNSQIPIDRKINLTTPGRCP